MKHKHYIVRDGRARACDPYTPGAVDITAPNGGTWEQKGKSWIWTPGSKAPTCAADMVGRRVRADGIPHVGIVEAVDPNASANVVIAVGADRYSAHWGICSEATDA